MARMGKIFYHSKLREHIFYFFEKGLVAFFRAWSKILVGQVFFKKLFLFLVERFWCPNIDVNQQISGSIAVDAWNSFSLESKNFSGLDSFFQLDSYFSVDGFDIFRNSKNRFGKTDVQIIMQILRLRVSRIRVRFPRWPRSNLPARCFPAHRFLCWKPSIAFRQPLPQEFLCLQFHLPKSFLANRLRMVFCPISVLNHHKLGRSMPIACAPKSYWLRALLALDHYKSNRFYTDTPGA